jgi:tetratricopeptide (TPR) repeat protein
MSERACNVDSLRVVAHAVAGRKTGILNHWSRQGAAVLIRGQLMSDAALGFLTECLYMDGATFDEIELDRTPRGVFPSKPLRIAATPLCSTARIQSQLGRVMRDTLPTTDWGAVGMRPLTRDFMALSRTNDPPLQWLVDMHRSDEVVLFADLALAETLGLIWFQDRAKRVKRDLTHDRAEREARHQRQLAKTIAALLRRPVGVGTSVAELNAEWEVVRQADAWPAVGLARKDLAADVIHAAIDRARSRYDRLSEDNRVPTEAAGIMRKLHMKYNGSANLVGRALADRKHVHASAAVYKMGEQAQAAGDWSGAYKAYEKAHELNPLSPMVVAKLGWALYKISRGDPVRLQNARDLLENGAAISDNVPDPLLYLAELEALEGNRWRAELLLIDLLTRDANNARARKLLRSIRAGRYG